MENEELVVMLSEPNSPETVDFANVDKGHYIFQNQGSAGCQGGSNDSIRWN